ncbi:MAG TPA: hypothetical protein VMV49_00305 [Candidatus Deferrimicrobium sp.]|nr:hypothetical protein [Candidatus Deferrimicrobium sp.]
MIQHFLILKRTGENIYKKCFGNIDMNETIMSGFFSAFFTFTQSLCGADVQDVELGSYRMLFESVGKEIILAIIVDKSDSIINVQQKLRELKNIIGSQFEDAIKKNACRTEDFKGLNDICEQLISKPATISMDENLKSIYSRILEELRSNNEILDCVLLSINGIPLQTTKKDFLDLCIKQMDAFWKFKSKVLDQIILYYEDRYVILHKINESFVLSVLLRKDTPIGYGTLLVEETVNKIANL